MANRILKDWEGVHMRVKGSLDAFPKKIKITSNWGSPRKEWKE